MNNKEIIVTGCHDCPFRNTDDDWCSQENIYVTQYSRHEKIYTHCELKTESITIKLKEDE